MRELTLNEKITLKGKLEIRVIGPLPRLDMRDALHFWSYCLGTSIAEYAKVRDLRK